jgi:hypothetical protein
VVDSGEVGRSAVYSKYNNGSRPLPWGTAALTGRVHYTSFQPLRGSVCYAIRILGEGNNSERERERERERGRESQS